MYYIFKKIHLLLSVTFVSLAACSYNLDFDLRDQLGGLLDTSSAANSAVANRPDPDALGVITFSNYQVMVAKKGDKIVDLAERIGIDSATLGSYNGISQEAILRHGEIIALPPTNISNRVTGKPLVPKVVDIRELSEESSRTNQPTSIEPMRHQVTNGETTFTIARLYNVSANDLANWNGLDLEMNIRNGQYLLIPLSSNNRTAISTPGQGSSPSTPPSSSRPQPQGDLKLEPAATTIIQTPVANTGQATTVSSVDSRFVRPVIGDIIRGYKKGQNEGIDISAKSGSIVTAADDGIVAAITKDTNGIPILVIKHVDGLLTVYTNIGGLTVKKGERVNRGQKIAVVGAGTPSFLHFEVRRGLVSVDPDDYI